MPDVGQRRNQFECISGPSTKSRYTDRSKARLDPDLILHLVPSHADVLVIRTCYRTHEEAHAEIQVFPFRFGTANVQTDSVHPLK